MAGSASLNTISGSSCARPIHRYGIGAELYGQLMVCHLRSSLRRYITLPTTGQICWVESAGKKKKNPLYQGAYGQVRRRWLIGVGESEVGRRMGDARARGGWICTTGEHVSFFGCSCVICTKILVRYVHQIKKDSR